MTGPDRRPVIFLGVPMAINVRDVLRSGVLSRILEAGVEVHLFSNAAGSEDFRHEFDHPQITIHPLVDPTDPDFIRLDARLIRVHTLLLSLRCETVEIMTRASRNRSALRRAIRSLVGVSGRGIQDWLLARGRRIRARRTPDLYGPLFDRYRPDLVVGTRVLTMTGPREPSNPRYLDRHLLVEGTRRGVRSAVLVASWDNLTTAGFFPVEPDLITVWSEEMAAQAREIHGIPGDRIRITGAPQHDVYAEPSRTTRDAFWRARGFDPARPVIVYATGTEGLIPGEPALVRALADELPAGAQLLLRLHQLDTPERYRDLLDRDDLRVDRAGKPQVEGYPDRDFDLDELRRLADTLRHADVVVNVGSSISLDAAAVGTPVVVLDWDAEPGTPYLASARRFYDFTHLRPVVESGGVARARSPEEARTAIRRYLDDPTRDAAAREAMVARLCHPVDGHAAERMAGVILEAVGHPTAKPGSIA